jgi:hypothetical protein
VVEDVDAPQKIFNRKIDEKNAVPYANPGIATKRNTGREA